MLLREVVGFVLLVPVFGVVHDAIVHVGGDLSSPLEWGGFFGGALVDWLLALFALFALFALVFFVFFVLVLFVLLAAAVGLVLFFLGHLRVLLTVKTRQVIRDFFGLGDGVCNPKVTFLAKRVTDLGPFVAHHLFLEVGLGLAVFLEVVGLLGLALFVGCSKVSLEVFARVARRAHADEHELLLAFLSGLRAVEVPPVEPLHVYRGNVRVHHVHLRRGERVAPLFFFAQVPHQLGALLPLAATLVALDELDNLVDPHAFGGAFGVLACFDRQVVDTFLELQVARDHLVAQPDGVRVVLLEIPRHRNLERLGRELEVNQNVVEVDIFPRERTFWCRGRWLQVSAGRVPLDQAVLEFDHAPHHQL